MSLPTGFAVIKSLRSLLTPGEQDTFTVRMDTATAGIKTGQISFVNGDSDESPFNFQVTGVVVSPLTLVYVDGAATCPSPNGSLACPFPTIWGGYDVAANCGKLRIRADSYAVCRSVLTRGGVFESYGGPVTLRGPRSGSLPLGASQPVKLSSAASQGDGSFQLRLAGEAGVRCQIFTSEDLVEWDLWIDRLIEPLSWCIRGGSERELLNLRADAALQSRMWRVFRRRR